MAIVSETAVLRHVVVGVLWLLPAVSLALATFFGIKAWTLRADVEVRNLLVAIAVRQAALGLTIGASFVGATPVALASASLLVVLWLRGTRLGRMRPVVAAAVLGFLVGFVGTFAVSLGKAAAWDCRGGCSFRAGAVLVVATLVGAASALFLATLASALEARRKPRNPEGVA